MVNKTYGIAQLTGWVLAYTLLALAVMNRPIYVPTELFYAALLVGTAALGSHIIRVLYKRLFIQRAAWKQASILAFGSVLMASISALVLVAVVFLLSKTDFAYPIPESQRWYVAKTLFINNFPNMAALLFLWSAIYFATTKVRQLRQVNQLLQETKLEALINQLNPHFLFNAMNNIRALILEDPSRARDKLSALSDMLRYSLNKDNKVKVTLMQELQVVNDYIALCAIQFEERLTFKSDVSEDCNRALVPRMLLQLCIENAIKHGIDRLVEGGTVELTIDHDKESVHIKVSNDGILADTHSSSGIGLQNLKQRLTILYGYKANISLEQNASRVTTKITIPLEYKLEDSHC